jgi:hypothetical protein
MANRTIQFLGSGYAPTGTDPITVSATLNGNVVYTGTIPTAYTSEIDHLPAGQVTLFTCELPVDFSGTVPMSISFNSPVESTVFFEQVLSNYMPMVNPVYTPTQVTALTDPTTPFADKMAIWTALAVPPLSEADVTVLTTGTTWTEEKQAVLDAHNLAFIVSSGATTFLNVNGDNDSRTNVVINGEPSMRNAEPTGTWGWVVDSTGEVPGLFECNLTAIAGQE